MKKFLPVPVFWRRNPDLSALSAAIAQTVTGRTGLALAIPRANRLIGTAPVIMTDGVVHGMQPRCGPAEGGPPQRPLIGAYTVDLDNRESSVTEQFLVNIGKDPAAEPLTGRSVADDIPVGAFNEGEAMALSWTVDLAPGTTFAANWAFADGSRSAPANGLLRADQPGSRRRRRRAPTRPVDEPAGNRRRDAGLERAPDRPTHRRDDSPRPLPGHRRPEHLAADQMDRRALPAL